MQGEQATLNANPHLISLTIACLPPFPSHFIPLTVDWMTFVCRRRSSTLVSQALLPPYGNPHRDHLRVVISTTGNTTHPHAAAASVAMTNPRPPCRTQRCREPNAEPRCRPRARPHRRTLLPDRPRCQTHIPVSLCPECYQTRIPPVLSDLVKSDPAIWHSMLGLLSASNQCYPTPLQVMRLRFRCDESALQDYSRSYYGSNYVSFGYSITTIVTRVIIFCGRVGFSQG